MNTGRRVLRRKPNGAARRQPLPTNFPVVRKITMRRTSSLVPYARNARTHSEQQLDALEASIRRFGFRQPVAIDSKSGIWAGHARVMVAERIGMREVPTVDVSDMTDDERRAYAIADNQMALLAAWDEELLTSELADLDLSGFDMDVIGFTERDLGGLGVGGPGAGGDQERQAVPAAWAVIVDCKDEGEQVALIERLQADGFKVKGTIG